MFSNVQSLASKYRGQQGNQSAGTRAIILTSTDQLFLDSADWKDLAAEGQLSFKTLDLRARNARKHCSETYQSWLYRVTQLGPRITKSDQVPVPCRWTVRPLAPLQKDNERLGSVSLS